MHSTKVLSVCRNEMNYSVSLLYLLLYVFSIWLLYLNIVKRAIHPLIKFATSPHPLSSDGASRWRRGKESTCQCRRCQRHGLDPWDGKIPWRSAWQPTPVFLPGEPHEQRSLAGYNPWGHKELDTAEAICMCGPSMLPLLLLLLLLSRISPVWLCATP